MLLARNVRKTIADAIINRIFSANGNGAVATSATEFALPEEDGLIGLVEGRAGAMTPAQEDVEVFYVRRLVF